MKVERSDVFDGYRQEKIRRLFAQAGGGDPRVNHFARLRQYVREAERSFDREDRAADREGSRLERRAYRAAKEAGGAAPRITQAVIRRMEGVVGPVADRQDVDRDHELRAERSRDAHRKRIGERSVDEPAVSHPPRRKQARHRHARADRVDGRSARECDLVARVEVGGHGREGNGEILDPLSHVRPDEVHRGLPGEQREPRPDGLEQPEGLAPRDAEQGVAERLEPVGGERGADERSRARARRDADREARGGEHLEDADLGERGGAPAAERHSYGRAVPHAASPPLLADSNRRLPRRLRDARDTVRR